MRRLVTLVVSVVVLLLGACGDEAPSAAEAVREAQTSLDERESGRIEFALRASTEGSDEVVGFEIEGPYAFGGGSNLAVLDLTYRMLLGDETQETRVVSTGEEAFVVAGGERKRLTADQAASLRLARDEFEGVPTLDLSAWLVDGEVREDGNRTTVNGSVRASAFVADLQRVAASAAGARGGKIDDDLARRIDRAAKTSEMTLATEGSELRSLRAVVEFGADVPPALREALGSYAAAKLELVLDIDDVRQPLRVDAPE